MHWCAARLILSKEDENIFLRWNSPCGGDFNISGKGTGVRLRRLALPLIWLGELEQVIWPNSVTFFSSIKKNDQAFFIIKLSQFSKLINSFTSYLGLGIFQISMIQSPFSNSNVHKEIEKLINRA